MKGRAIAGIVVASFAVACWRALRWIVELVRGSPPFPKDFVFGVATADHQCEAYDPAFGPDIRDRWEEKTQTVPRGRATDFWNRYAGDIDLAKSLGCRAFRISISWARIERTAGEFDTIAIEHYRAVLQKIADAGMASIVTLHHNTWPVHVEERGGMIDDHFPDWFAAYARRIATDLGELISHYVTINEPNQLAFGYVRPWWSAVYAMPPGLERGADTKMQLDAVAKLIRNLFLANARAYAAIHEVRGSKASVGTNPFLLGLPLWLQDLLDWNATRVSEKTFAQANRRFTEPLFHEIGDVDVVVAQFTATLARTDDTNFTEAYLMARCALLQHANAPEPVPQSFAAPIAVVTGTTPAQSAPRLFRAATFVQAGDVEEAVGFVQNGRAAAVFADDLQLAPYDNPASGFKLFSNESWSAEESYVAAVAPGNRQLLHAIDIAVKNFKTPGAAGEPSAWETSVTKHLPQLANTSAPTRWRRANLANVPKVTPPRPAAVPGQPFPKARKGTALRAIQDRGRLRVGVRPGRGGLCEQTRDGYVGFEPDLARFMALQIFGTPDAVEFRPLNAQERIKKLRSRLRFVQPAVRIGSTLSTILTTNWWHLGMSGRLPEFLCPVGCAGKQDFVGLDYYWGIPSTGLHRIEQLFNASRERYSRAPVWPSAMRKMLGRLSKRFPGKDIIVVENGCVDRAGGLKRSAYLRRHIREVQRALSDGSRVAAYLCWSITTNREWGLRLGVNSDFGLYYVDLDGDSLERVTRDDDDSPEVYAQIIAAGSAR